MAGILYLLPNVLGTANLLQADDIHLVIPANVQLITSELRYLIAENAKSTRAFLKLLGQIRPLSTKLQDVIISELNVNTHAGSLSSLLEPILAGQDGGLISEAGVPAVADPGANLVRLAHRLKIKVKPLVGPSSILLAIMASGLNGQNFAFNGYLPIDSELRNQRIRQLEERSRKENQTQIFIETPYRNKALFEALIRICHPTTLISLATNLTLQTESICTRTAEKWKLELNANNCLDLHKKPSVFLILAE